VRNTRPYDCYCGDRGVAAGMIAAGLPIGGHGSGYKSGYDREC
jgi:hypothetical protein